MAKRYRQQPMRDGEAKRFVEDLNRETPGFVDIPKTKHVADRVRTVMIHKGDQIRKSAKFVSFAIEFTLEAILRPVIALSSDRDDQKQSRQTWLALFPEDEREIAGRIKREWLYIPSLNARVPVHDGSRCTPAELREGGGYLRKLIAEMADEAQAIDDLADYRERKMPKAAA